MTSIGSLVVDPATTEEKEEHVADTSSSSRAKSNKSSDGKKTEDEATGKKKQDSMATAATDAGATTKQKGEPVAVSSGTNVDDKMIAMKKHDAAAILAAETAAMKRKGEVVVVASGSGSSSTRTEKESGIMESKEGEDKSAYENITKDAKVKLESAKVKFEDMKEDAKEKYNAVKSTAFDKLNKTNEGAMNTAKSFYPRIKSVLPERMRTIVDKVESKTPSQWKEEAVITTRKNLLSSTKEDDTTLRSLAIEVKNAAFSGILARNVLDKSEDLIRSKFGPIEKSENERAVFRAYHQSMKVATGLKDYASEKLGNVAQKLNPFSGRRSDAAQQPLSTSTVVRGRTFTERYGDVIIKSVPFVGRITSIYQTKTTPSQGSVTSSSSGNEHLGDHEESAIPPTADESVLRNESQQQTTPMKT